jgi:hypothetical protein
MNEISEKARHWLAGLLEGEGTFLAGHVEAGESLPREIARDYGISKWNVYAIVQRRSWAHIA